MTQEAIHLKPLGLDRFQVTNRGLYKDLYLFKGDKRLRISFYHANLIALTKIDKTSLTKREREGQLLIYTEWLYR